MVKLYPGLLRHTRNDGIFFPGDMVEKTAVSERAHFIAVRGKISIKQNTEFVENR